MTVKRYYSFQIVFLKNPGSFADLFLAGVYDFPEWFYGNITERHQGKPFGRDDVPLCQIPDDLFLQAGKPVCKPPGDLEQQDACPLEQ